MRDFQHIEDRRADLQRRLDQEKTQLERNKLGQFSTPFPLATEIVAEALRCSNGAIRFIDPAIGTGVFFSALQAKHAKRKIELATGFEIDPHYGVPSAGLWTLLGLDLKLGDFTKEPAEQKYNLLVCNPPYVRHHHIDKMDKLRLAELGSKTGVRLSGLAGLYCHFMTISDGWMVPGGISAWLVPSEFMDVNYGVTIKNYLMNRVTLLRIHRFDPADAQFNDALVSSAVLWFRHSPPPIDHKVSFSYGGTIEKPGKVANITLDTLRTEHKWTRFPQLKKRNTTHNRPRLGDYFQIKRGLATGANEVFILTPEQVEEEKIPRKFLKPILPSPRYLNSNVVESESGLPVTKKRLFLLDVRIEPDAVKAEYPELWKYLEKHRASLADAYLLKNRKVWYFQENREPASLLCTYMGRGEAGNPFNFILNKSNATAANAYHMLYPKEFWADKATPELFERLWGELNKMTAAQLTSEGRVYGGGLHKLEPKELSNVALPVLAEIIGNTGN